jgi:hypothetical protein
MKLLTFLAQAVDPNSAPIGAPPLDEGNWGAALVVATLITIGIMFLVCSPIRRD